MRQIKIILNSLFSLIWKFPRNIAILFISLYQVLLSPDHSWLKAKYPYGFCKHYPTCSEYSKQALYEFGFIKGFVLTVKRVITCNPWTEPKVDLINKK